MQMLKIEPIEKMLGRTIDGMICASHMTEESN